MLDAATFKDIALANPASRQLLAALAELNIPQLHSVRDGISRYLVRCTCVGIEASTGEVFAPDGFADLQSGNLRVNPLLPRPGLWQAKAHHYRARWPWLQIIEE